jgi:hypothetical protein
MTKPLTFLLLLLLAGCVTRARRWPAPVTPPLRPAAAPATNEWGCIVTRLGGHAFTNCAVRTPEVLTIMMPPAGGLRLQSTTSLTGAGWRDEVGYKLICDGQYAAFKMNEPMKFFRWK